MTPELRTILYLAKHYPNNERRQRASERFYRVEAMVARMDGMSDEEADAFYAWLIAGAASAREVVAAFIERIKAARRQVGGHSS
jgi:hypothetical protein